MTQQVLEAPLPLPPPPPAARSPRAIDEPTRPTDAPERSSGSAVFALVFGLTLLLSSSLLFLVQPMFAKLVLPRLGGTAAVWNTCMVFFQACLLAGYGYSHFITRRLSVSRQVMVHSIVLLLPVLMLPLGLPRGWSSPPANASPIGWLLVLLAMSVGLPFFVIATTAPLVQRWFALTRHRDAGDPYFLYAASNAGSMTALLAYPTIVEPLVRVGDQAKYWAWGYVAFAIATLGCGVIAAIQTWHGRLAHADENDSAPAGGSCHEVVDEITWTTRLHWIALALVPSSYLLGVTTYITTDVAAVPLLWVLPLAIYLLTFILAFAKRPIVSHRAFVYALPTAVLAPVMFLLARAALPVGVNVGMHLLAFFVAAMVCHGELARLRPAPRHLTEFFLLMSLGGVLGGAFNALAAPMLFDRALEYPLGIALAALLCPPRTMFQRPCARREGEASAEPRVTCNSRLGGSLALPSVSRFVMPLMAVAIAPMLWVISSIVESHNGGMPARFLALMLPLLLCVRLAGRRAPFAIALAGLLAVASFCPGNRAHVLEVHRSFFGVHRVVRSVDGRFNELYHGTTIHGRQQIDLTGQPIHGDEPLTYYHRQSPIGSVMNALAPEKRKNVGVIGLGVGSLAAYAQAGQTYTFYEIDPLVRWAADESGYFSYLKGARARGADVQIVLGDARLTLANAPDHSLDLLVLDAFSGDSVPLHLLTREALEGYRRKLKPEGVLAVHISNLYLNLEPVLANLAADADCIALFNNDLDMTAEKNAAGKAASQWMLIASHASREEASVEFISKDPRWVASPRRADKAVWTDDYSNILSILR
jgi:spermidine synthase